MNDSVDTPLRTKSNLLQFPEQPGLRDDPDEDDSVEIQLLPSDDGYSEEEEEEPEPDAQDFDGNLAKAMSSQDLKILADELLYDIDEDITSRAEWEKPYKESLRYLGINPTERSEPWQNACRVV